MTRDVRRWLLSFALALVAFAAVRPVFARTVLVPEGGRAVQVVSEGVVCGPLPTGWAIDGGDRRLVRPPAPESSASRSIEVRVADSAGDCDKSKTNVGVVAIARFPEIDPASVVFWPDEGRLDLRGQRLRGVQIVWQGKDDKDAKDSCLDPASVAKVPSVAAAAGVQQCTVPLQRNLRFDTPLYWLPAGAFFGPDVTFFDAAGGRLDKSFFALRPARTLISQLVAPGVSVDVAAGPGRVPLLHPQAVTSVDCGAVRCELAEGSVMIRSVPSLMKEVPVRLRLAPRVALVKGDVQETQVSVSVPLLQCPLTFASGAPLRDAEDSHIVLRMDPRCARETRLRFFMNGEAVDPARAPVKTDDGVYLELKVGRLLGDRATVTVTRGDVDATMVATASIKTMPAPRPRVSLELPKHGKTEFVPTNRDAVLTVAALGDGAKLVPLSDEGAYNVRASEGHYLLRGDQNAGGFVTLRFGYRVTTLPGELAAANLAVIEERTQRAVREASIPAPFSVSADSPAPLAELVCADRDGATRTLAPSMPHMLAHRARNTCRLVIHGDRIEPEFGTQEVELEVEVTTPEGRRRPEASFSQHLILLPQSTVRVVPIKGGVDEFDQILVRLSVVLDESRYALSPTARTGLPSLQWTALVEGGHFRLYATAAIPAGLYRMNQPTGQLTLNFGVLSRIAWLDRRGKESLLGAEVGLMGMGLIQRPGAVEYPPTLGAIAGLGVRVPLGSGGAAVGVHVWGVYEFRDKELYYVPDAARPDERKKASHFAFIFGPSISIGNVGTNF